MCRVPEKEIEYLRDFTSVSELDAPHAKHCNGMDRWPTDTRLQRENTQKKGRKRTKQNAPVPIDYPSVKIGELGAANLCEVNGRLEWTSLVNNDKGTPFLLENQACLIVD
jgi:hypothetical protein